MFAASTWLVRPAERAYMWQEGNERVAVSFYDKLENAKYIGLEDDEYDVFGDGSAIVKFAPGHSPGHQVLVLNLAVTGRIVLGGDLYHYAAERILHRPSPAGDDNPDQTRTSRAMIDAYLERTGAELWIGHDFVHDASLRKAPAYYE
jgi:glyoxylase-like metal-dependent hydrolase (beta-lactamase superfamily II)